jgi:hypothetical protein
MKKRGQIGDIATILIVLTSIILTLILSRYVYVQVQDGLSDSGLSTPESEQALIDMAQLFPMFDTALIFIMLGLTGSLVITSWLLPSRPLFIGLNIVGLFILVFVAAILSNVYSEIINDQAINQVLQDTESSGLTDFGGSDFIMRKLPLFCIFIVAISTIALYAKGRGVQENF